MYQLKIIIINKNLSYQCNSIFPVMDEIINQYEILASIFGPCHKKNEILYARKLQIYEL